MLVFHCLAVSGKDTWIELRLVALPRVSLNFDACYCIHDLVGYYKSMSFHLSLAGRLLFIVEP